MGFTKYVQKARPNKSGKRLKEVEALNAAYETLMVIATKAVMKMTIPTTIHKQPVKQTICDYVEDIMPTKQQR
jgi:hypothetical protein